VIDAKVIDAEVIVVGLGPAGRALAHRAAAAGLDVLAVDPRPDRPWTATYAAWLDELPPWLPESVLAARVAEPSAWTVRPHRIPRPYGVFDASALQRSLSLDGVRVCTARADVVAADHVALADGAALRARAVIDARGGPAHRSRAQQTAFGVIVDTATAAPALQGRDAWFMDWRRDNRTDSGDAPSFLYAVPLGQDRMLLEETCLVGRPALPLPELRRRLEVRLAARGVELSGSEPVERVRFGVQPPPESTRGVARFGARGGLMHPGTGYAVAASLAAADPVAHALAGGRKATAALWSPSARAVAQLRASGLRVLLKLHPEQTPAFFAGFFTLPPERQRSYLSGRTDLGGTVAAMTRMFTTGSPALRGAMLRALW